MADGAGRPALSLPLLAAVVFLTSGIGFAAVELAWLRDLQQPRVILLGAGSSLSVLVTDGAARVLIATGDDPTAFGNALGRMLHPGQERIDLVVAAGEGDGLRAAAFAAEQPAARGVVALVPFGRSPDRPSLQTIPLLGSPRRIELGETEIAVETAADGNRGGWSWRATVERGASRVVILSDGRAGELFPPMAAPAVLVVASGGPMEGWAQMPATALAFPDATISPERLRNRADSGEEVPARIVRVFPGEATELHFVDGGLALPAEGTTELRLSADRATPER